MKMRIEYLALAVPLLLGGCAAPEATPRATAQGESMQRMAADVNLIRAFVYGGSRADARGAATDLVAWSKRIPELFPPGASNEYVDMSPTRVRNANVAMVREAEKLLLAVRTASIPAVGDQLVAAEHNGCGACHLSATH